MFSKKIEASNRNQVTSGSPSVLQLRRSLRLALASGCIIQYVGHVCFLAGTMAERRRAKVHLIFWVPSCCFFWLLSFIFRPLFLSFDSCSFGFPSFLLTSFFSFLPSFLLSFLSFFFSFAAVAFFLSFFISCLSLFLSFPSRGFVASFGCFVSFAWCCFCSLLS